MADFNGATQIDLTPQALAMIRLIQAGQGTNSDSRFTGRFGPGFPPMPVEPETEPRLFQYQPGTNLMMIPRMGYNSLPFATLRAMAGACKEIRINIEHIKRIMRGVDWDIIPNDKKKTVVGGKTYVATPETESVKKFFQRPDGINPFDAWLNMVLEEVLVTDALTFWPVQERGRELQAVEVIDGTTIKPLLDMRGATPRPPMPAYLQIIWGTPQSSYPANTLIYRPLNTKVNSPYGESPIEWVLTAINTAIRKDLSAVGYYADGNIPGAFYTVPESWTPEQIQTFQSYIDALMAGDLSRFAKLLAVPGGTGSHVTTFQNNDPDNPALNEYLMKVACWAYGNNPAEFGITGGAGLGGAGFMEGSENIQQRSLIGPVSNFLAGIFTEIIHDWMRRPDLRFSWTGLEPVEDRATQATADQANIGLGVYNVAYVQDREGIPQEYRPTSAPSADPKVGSGTLPMPLPPGYEQYLKRAIDADLKQWETKALRSLKKGWGAASFTSEVIPEGVHASISEKLEKATTEADVKAAFVVDLELHKHYGPGTHKSASSPPDLYKRDETERVMADEMTEYFTGLADRITSAVRDADGAVLNLMNLGGETEVQKLAKHDGPGPHDNGSPQEVHAGGGHLPDSKAEGKNIRTYKGKKFDFSEISNVAIERAAAIPYEKLRTRRATELLTREYKNQMQLKENERAMLAYTTGQGDKKAKTILESDVVLNSDDVTRLSRQMAYIEEINKQINGTIDIDQAMKFDFTSGQSAADSLSSLLDRRVMSIHQNWTRNYK